LDVRRDFQSELRLLKDARWRHEVSREYRSFSLRRFPINTSTCWHTQKKLEKYAIDATATQKIEHLEGRKSAMIPCPSNYGYLIKGATWDRGRT
jgi:hypothetical protein